MMDSVYEQFTVEAVDSLRYRVRSLVGLKSLLFWPMEKGCHFYYMHTSYFPHFDIDGFSGELVGFVIMPQKNNVTIYEHLYI